MPRSGDLPAPKPETPAPARARSSASELAAFLAASRATAPRGDAGRGRLIFALDATMSRQPTWDLACRVQGEMFAAASEAGGLSVQLVYFRGFGECRASRWVADPRAASRAIGAGLRLLHDPCAGSRWLVAAPDSLAPEPSAARQRQREGRRARLCRPPPS